MDLFKIKREKIEVYIPNDGDYKLSIHWSILCYPIVIDDVEERFSNPSIDKQKRLMHYMLPNEALRFWYKCLFRKKKFINKILIPYLANCCFYEIKGTFAHGHSTLRTNKKN